MTTHLYYHNDLDGHASAAIAALACEDPDDIKYYEMNYGKPFNDSEVNYNKDIIIMVDFSLQPEDMKKLLSNPRFIWIDHHATSVKWFNKAVATKEVDAGCFNGILDAGLRAACELAWQYFNPEEEIPEFIKCISRYDVWNKGDDWEDKILPVKYYLESIGIDPANKFWWWHENIMWFVENRANEAWTEARLQDWISKGKTLLEFQTKQLYDSSKDDYYTSLFDGKHACIINSSNGGSAQFETIVSLSDYELLVSYRRSKNEFWRVGLYSENKSINCGEIAQRLGQEGPCKSGGGHPGAAGFQTDTQHLAKLLGWDNEKTM
jgi:oligoribonuclease NrnB/cAMP/cGMP phosphodiesterase (DHH superfamily)